MLMRFLTMDWWEGVQQGDHTDAPAEYRAYFESIRHCLPTNVVALEDVDLHDANIRSVRFDGESAQLELRADLCDGPALKPCVMVFRGVTQVQFSSDPERGLPGPRGFGDLGYWEVDLAEEAYEFRALFSTGVEMAVRFADVTIASG